MVKYYEWLKVSVLSRTYFLRCLLKNDEDKRIETAMVSWTKKRVECNVFGSIDIAICDKKCRDYKTGEPLDLRLYEPESISYLVEIRAFNSSLELELPIACKCVSKNATRSNHSHFMFRLFGGAMNYAIRKFRDTSLRAKCKRVLRQS